MDASAGARKTSATISDRDIIRNAGFWPRKPNANPVVKERIGRVQYALAHDQLLFDPDGAPFMFRAIQRHEYERGSNPPQPRKHWGDGDDPLDAATDALGYLVCGVANRASLSLVRAA